MSSSFQYGSAPSRDPGESNSALYGARYIPGLPHVSQPASQPEGLAFWYRTDSVDSGYDTNVNVFSREGLSVSTEQVKHRRTRSGCFTCRSRRVKCDETRPICDRCKKGHRECDFPQPTSSKRAKRAEARASQIQSADADEDDAVGLATIKDENEDGATPEMRPKLEKLRTHSTQSLSKKAKHRPLSETSSTSKDKTGSPSTDASSSISGSQTPASSFQAIPSSASTVDSGSTRWSHLKPDIQKYLHHHQCHVTHYHYMFIYDPDDFFHATLVDLALTYEPLLYAIVAFSAYHHALRQTDARLSDFLAYYGRSLTLLRRALERDSQHSAATLLTVLQLATFEEYLGDWISLAGHYGAAHQMLLELYTPDTVLQHQTTRMLFAWYARFDVVAGLMAGNEAILAREWNAKCERWYERQIDHEDVDIENTVQWFVAANRLLAMDIATLFSKLPKGLIGIPEFVRENVQLERRLQDLKERIKPLNDGYYAVTDFPHRVPLTADDIVNPYIPGGLFRDAFWPLNYVWVSWYGLWQMHRSHTAIILQQAAPNELEMISLEQCRIWEAIQRWPDAPDGCMCGAHASLAIASVFLQKDARHTMWARRKLAAIERSGYIFPPTFRKKMAELWKLPEVEHWWLPQDDGYMPLLQQIRALVEERVSSQKDRDKAGKGEDLRDIKGIFSKMNLGTDSISPTSSPSSTSSGPAGASSPGAVDGHVGTTLPPTHSLVHEQRGMGAQPTPHPSLRN